MQLDFIRKFSAQLLLFAVQLTLCCVTAQTNQLVDEVGAVSLLQFTAKAAHHASDADRTKVQLGMAAEFEYAEGFFGFSERRKAVSIFCYAIEGPADLTGKQLRQQMKGCDGYTSFSYLADPQEHLVNMFSAEDMKVGKTPYGWADNARLMPRVIQYIIASDLPERFTWFVKLDPDSFFRPRFLYPILAKYDAESPMGLGSCPRCDTPMIRGAMEIFSHKVFRDNNTALLLDMDRPGGEDNELSVQMNKAGFPIIRNDKPEDCSTLFFNYENIPHDETAAHEIWNMSVIPNTLREFFANTSVTCLELPAAFPSFPGVPNRIHRDVVVAHPVKDVETYEELQALDNAMVLGNHS